MRCLVIAISALFAACEGPTSPKLLDLAGATHAPLDTATDSIQVFVVTSQECPIANAYSPVIGDLAQRWRERPVELFVVHADPDLDAAAAAEHARDYELPGTILLDPRHELIGALGATKTPEAVVRHRGEIHYRGRIDDQWKALGSRGQEASTHDLRDAVDALLDGKAVKTAATEVIGCFLPEPGG